MLALVFGLLAAAPAPAVAAEPRVTIAVLPAGTQVEEIAAAVPGISPGVLSAGLGRVPASQTYLDIGQGSRLFSSLYPEQVPALYVSGDRVPAWRWRVVLERAAGGPATIEPGLLASSLEDVGIRIGARPLAGSPGLIAADRRGRVARTTDCDPGACRGVAITAVDLSELAALGRNLEGHPQDVLIAIERPPPERDLLSIGIAGGSFGDGNLTSATTRMDGYVISTDLLPTILSIYGVEVPEGVSGREIEPAGGTPDAAAVAELEERLGQVGPRRWPVIAVNLLIWLGAVLVATAIGRRRGAAMALAMLAVTAAYAPALLLLAAALEPSLLAERLVVGLGSPAAAAATLLALRGRLGGRAPYGAFALAALISVASTAIHVVAGSPLTTLLGPNPAIGVRFFGIGNELEATIAALLTLGVGAAVSALRPADSGRTVALAGGAATLLAVAAFAPGRFGADVGAAITFPAGAAAIAIVALELGLRRALLVAAAPLVALLALIAVDVVSGGDAHLSRSVLGAGGLDELRDVLERRVILGASSFARYLSSPFFVAVLAFILAGFAFRRRIAGWMEEWPAALAGLIGAVVATVVGTLANDSAALLLMVGTAFIVAFCGLAWAVGPGSAPERARGAAATAARLPSR